MTKKIVLLPIIIFLGVVVLFAQNQTDAIRYSELFYQGSAKSVAMGSSLSAVGADMSVLGTNPAGMAIYKRSHFEISPEFILSKTNSKYNGTNREEQDFGFKISNFGWIGVIDIEDSDWKRISFGIAYNRIKDFTQETVVRGENETGSILDYFVYNANSPHSDEYGDRYSSYRESLAWETYLLEKDGDEYYKHVVDEGEYGETQRKQILTSGGMGEWDFSFAINYLDILYMGGTFGIQNMNFEQDITYKEHDFTDVFRESVDEPNENIQEYPEEFIYKESLKTEGNGFNFKFGMLFQPFEFVRIGGAVHSSTFSDFVDYYSTSIYARFPTADENDDSDYYFDSGEGKFDWKLTSPFRANAGLAFILRSYEFGNFYTAPMTISFEYEFTDYSNMKLKEYYSGDYTFDNENELIKNQFGESHSLRAGAELNFGLIKVRGGYSIYSSPYKATSDLFDNANFVYSGGISFASKQVYLDMSYSYSEKSESMYLYDATNVYPNNPIGSKSEPTAELLNNKHFAIVTFGFRF